ncbi:MAG TPA: transcription antitermination factor NusB [Verrucomicrobiae bacterium]|jgi:N utilization substance protein B|nr:transcription antitermination factor NusB [Verrucomicrobiae bacterium]
MGNSSRRLAREQALQALYSVAVGNRDAADAISEIVSDRATGEHRTFVRDLVLGTLDYQEKADAQIAPRLEGWTLERLPSLDRLILRMGTYELLCCPDMPTPVVINEAVELAKKFSTEDSGRYINGVLSALAAEHAKA